MLSTLLGCELLFLDPEIATEFDPERSLWLWGVVSAGSRDINPSSGWETEWELWTWGLGLYQTNLLKMFLWRKAKFRIRARSRYGFRGGLLRCEDLEHVCVLASVFFSIKWKPKNPGLQVLRRITPANRCQVPTAVPGSQWRLSTDGLPSQRKESWTHQVFTGKGRVTVFSSHIADYNRGEEADRKGTMLMARSRIKAINKYLK